MLDRRTSALLTTINGFCPAGRYQIFAAEDFLSALPQEWGLNAESLEQMLGVLSENGYIAVKYAVGGMYCLCPLPLGRGYSEKEKEERTESSVRIKYLTSFAFFGALVGGIIGGIITGALFLLFG